MNFLKNKTLLFIISVLFFSGINLTAQTSLPYYTGFDNQAQRTGWQQFRLGNTSSPQWTYSQDNPFSAPSKLYHDFPMGADPADTTINWFVSPAFDFSKGGKIDSLKFILWSISGQVGQADHLRIYLLIGSANPAMADSIILLADLTNQVSSNSSLWKDTGDFVIPLLQKPTHIGFNYRATNNWFVASIDNVYISGGGINSSRIREINQLPFYPNPAIHSITLDLPEVKNGVLQIIDVNGRVMQTEKNLQQGLQTLNVAHLTPGVYLLTITGENGIVGRQRFVKN
jgi:hypothetical protein